jgi:hypothetical protein
VAIGAPGNSAAYVFDLVGGVWTESSAPLTPAGAGYLGASVVLGDDLLAAGAPYSGTSSYTFGAVHVFRRIAGAWVADPAPITIPSLPHNAEFGFALALDDDSLLVGARSAAAQEGRAYVFADRGSAWDLVAEYRGGTQLAFGASTAIASDVAFVGSATNQIPGEAGEVYRIGRLLDVGSLRVAGNATGGSLTLRVGCDSIALATANGQSPTIVASALAHALNLDTELRARQVYASAKGDRLTIHGLPIANVSVAADTDKGAAVYLEGSACSDGIDNDNDGALDFPADKGCVAGADGSEDQVGIGCDDGLDNDGDSLVDYALTGGDIGCSTRTSSTENPACQDGLNNDGQLGIDFDGGASANGGVPLGPADPNCTGPTGSSEAPLTGGCGLGPELALGLPALMALRRARRKNSLNHGAGAP